MKKLSTIAALAAALAGCAYQPLIDRRGVDENRFAADLAECRAYAEQAPGEGESAAAGAAAGYAIGYGAAHVLGTTRRAEVGRFTALSGAISMVAAAAAEKRAVVARCLAGRGYRVLR